MPNKAFDRVIFRSMEALEYFDLLRMSGDAGLRAMLREVGVSATSSSDITPMPTASGFYGASFFVAPLSSPTTKVRIFPGVGMIRDDSDLPTSIDGVAGLDETSDMKPLVLRQPLLIDVSTPPAAPDQRIDIVEVRLNRDVADVEPRDFLNLTGPSARKESLNKPTTLSYAFDGLMVGRVTDPAPSTAALSYKMGQPSSPPMAPPTTAGYIKIAEILVDNVSGNPSGTIRQEHIADFRPLLFLGGVGHFGLRVLVPAAVPTPPTIQSAALPPGLRIALYNAQPTGAGQSKLFIVNKLTNAAVTPSTRDPRVPSAFELPLAGAAAFTTVDSTLKTQIEASTPAQKVPLGAPVVVVPIRIHKWTGTTFATDDFSDAGYNLTGVVS